MDAGKHYRSSNGKLRWRLVWGIGQRNISAPDDPLRNREGSVHRAHFPEVEERWLVEDNFTYPIAFNGKTRLTLDFPAGASKDDIEAAAKNNAEVQKYLEGKTIRKVIVVPKRMVNFVVG